MKEYEAYLFDLYGTLVDIHTDENRSSFWKKMCEIFAKQGVPYEWRQLRDAYFEGVRKEEEKRREAGHHIEIDLRKVFESLLSRDGNDADPDTVRETMEKFRDLSTGHIRVYAGGRDLLLSLREKKKKVILLSNAQEVFTMRELKDLGIHDLFDAIFISSSVGYKKPDPMFFEYALKECDLKPEDCLMIGNDVFCDIWGAARAGIDACYIRSALSPKEEGNIEAVCVLDRMDLGKLKRRIARSIDEK